MRRQRFGSFTGGLDLPDEKYRTRSEPIAAVGASSALRVPLDPCRLGEVIPSVRIGDSVRRGDLLAMAAGRFPVFSPTDGVVKGFGRCLLADRFAGLIDCPACLLAPSKDQGKAQAAGSHAEGTSHWREKSADSLLERLAAGGLTTMADSPFPLADWCVRAVRAGVDTLIVNGLENEPYLTAEHRLLAERGGDVVEGLAMLAFVTGARRARLAVDVRRTTDYPEVKPAADRLDVQSFAVEHKYPMGSPVMLTKVLTRRAVPPGRGTFDVGVGVLSVSATLAAYDWVTAGEPCLNRVLTVSGDRIGRPGNVRAALGTPAAHLLEHAHVSRHWGVLCCGGPMTGVEVPAEVVVGPATAGLLALPESPPEMPETCIRCAWCTDHCPVRLDVASLNDMYELGQLDRAVQYDVSACLGCGICSYVCPARLPLTHRMKQLRLAALAPSTIAREAQP